MNNAKIGAAVVGGYVLGRTKKAKLAISLGALLAGSRIKPGQVGKALHDSPFVHTLTDQVRSELTGAGKAAATSILTAKADNLADALHERTVGLREKSYGQAEEGDEGDERDTGRDATGEDEEDEEAEEAAEPEDETEPDEESRAEAPRGAGRGKPRRGKSEQAEEQPRKRKSSTSQSRSKSSGTARSRRQDDG